MRKGDELTHGGSLDFLLLLVLHLLTPSCHPAQGPADGEWAVEGGGPQKAQSVL